MTPSDQRAALRPASAGRSAFYRLPVDKPESAHEAQAQARADQRLRRQRDTLRPFGLVVIAAVAIGAISGHPAPAGHGTGLGVAAALALFAAALALAVRASFIDRSRPVQTATIASMAAAGVTLVALQPHGATELAGGAAVWMAVARLPLPLGAMLAAATTVGLALAEALAGGSAAVVLRYAGGHTSLTIDDRLATRPPDTASSVGVGPGGGNGLTGMRERLERAGGRMQAGPTDDGWRVELEVPA